MPKDSLGPGAVLDGKYEILNVIGAGGMGEVFKARHLHLDAFRCIKIMKASLLADETFRARFLREARLATQIHHPNIAVVHDFFLGEDGSYLVTEFIDGSTVRQWSGAYGAFPVAVAADVATQVLAGLDYIHRRGLLHRDISAENVMLAYDGDDCLAAKIIDLGVAKDTSGNGETTQTGMLIGNPKYMSPEQLGFIPDGEQIDGRADLYSLGVVLYEMLLGLPPFASETPQGYIMKHLTQPPPSFATKAEKGTLDCPPELEAIVFRALEKDRNRRFPDARAFATALEPFRIAPAGMLARADISRLRRGDIAMTPAASVAPTLAEPIDTATERDWKKTLAGDTAADFRDYLQKHPASEQSTEAKARLFELELLETVKEKEREHDRDTLKRLSEGHPKGSAVGGAAREALARLKDVHEEEDAFQRAWEEGTSEGWQRFIEAHPGTEWTGRASELLGEALAFEGASGAPSETGLREFLKVWPEGRHRLEAGIRLAAMRERAAQEKEEAARREAEPHDFDAAWETGTTAAWDAYLERHAGSSRTHEVVQLRQEAADFELAVRMNTVAMWRAFVKSWPDGRHRLEAQIRMREQP
jgi:serine/threonine protein kinase